MRQFEVYAEKQSNGDVIISRANGKHFATYPWSYENKPTQRNKYITLNCYKWRLIWK
jgi:hypothetical protein